MVEAPHTMPIVVKRYSGLRLYDPEAGQYRSLDDLRRWDAAGVAFLVRDAETGEDITGVLLA